MLKAKIKLIYLKLDKVKFTKTLIEKLETQNRQAARAWLRAVILKVPVWTGMAAGSLKPLGAFLRVAIPISPSSSSQAQSAMRRGQTEAAGEALGKFEFKNEDGQRFVFVFSTGVIHYLQNEYYAAPPGFHLIEETPWYSLRAGSIAYKQYMKENLKNKIPKLKSFIVRSTRELHVG